MKHQKSIRRHEIHQNSILVVSSPKNKNKKLLTGAVPFRLLFKSVMTFVSATSVN